MMKSLVLALMLFLLAALVVAQEAPPAYDPATEVTVRGVVTEVRDFSCPITATLGRHVEVRLADGSILEVHLAPAKFMNDFKINVTPGPITVVGSKVTFRGAPAVIARSFAQKNNYELRNENGRPYW
jgi:hypothetical protein